MWDPPVEVGEEEGQLGGEEETEEAPLRGHDDVERRGPGEVGPPRALGSTLACFNVTKNQEQIGSQNKCLSPHLKKRYSDSIRTMSTLE